MTREQLIALLWRKGVVDFDTIDIHSGGVANPAPAATAASVTGVLPGPVRVPICVLPFNNLSGDLQQQVFSDGRSEDIITELSRWRLLEVRSRSTSFKYRGGKR